MFATNFCLINKNVCSPESVVGKVTGMGWTAEVSASHCRLDVQEERNISCLCRELNPKSSIDHRVA
jgi:hypothetical protein